MKRAIQKSGQFFFITAVLGLFALVRLPLNQPLKAAAGAENQPTTMGLTGDLVIAKLMEHNRLRETRLQQYSAPRTYRVQDDKGMVRAEVQVVLHYRAPGTKEFKIVSEKGSGLIRSRVFNWPSKWPQCSSQRGTVVWSVRRHIWPNGPIVFLKKRDENDVFLRLHSGSPQTMQRRGMRMSSPPSRSRRVTVAKVGASR